MGPCNLASEPVCSSPPMFVADRADEVVDNAVNEGFIEHAMEPLSRLDLSSLTSGIGGDDSVAQFVDQLHLCSGLGGGLGMSRVEDGNTICESHVLADCDKHSEVATGKDNEKCSDSPKELVCETLGEKLHKLVVVPCSGLDNSPLKHRGEKDMVLASSSVDSFRILDHSYGSLEFRDGNSSGLCLNAACSDKDSEPISASYNVKHECNDNTIELGNELSIDCKLNKICLDGGQCEGGMNLCLTNLADDGIPSGNVAPSGSTAQYVSDANVVCDNFVCESLVDAVCSGTMDDGSAKSLVMPDTVTQNESILTPKITYEFESINGNKRNDNAGTDGDLCELKCLDTCSLPLRRSSRSRKPVQQVDRGKNAIKFTKKTSKVSRHQAIDLLSEATRKKRSSINRPTCSSGWGVSENLSKYFQGSNVAAINQLMDKRSRSRKKKEGQRSRKKNKLQLSQFPEGRQEVPYRPIRLKVTFGKKEEPCKVDGTPPVAIDALPGFQPCKDGKQLIFYSRNDSSRGDAIDSPAPKDIPKLVQCSNSTSNFQLKIANLETCSVSGKSKHDDSQLEFQKRDSSCADKLSEPSTSPDSEVIDRVLESTVGPRALTSLHNSVNKASCGNICHTSQRVLASSKKSKNRKNKKDKLCQAGNLVLECQHTIDSANVFKKSDQLQKLSKEVCVSAYNLTANSENLPSNTSSSELISMELLPVADEGSHKAPSPDIDGDNGYSKMVSGIELADSGNSCQLLPPAETQCKRNSKGSKTKGKSRNKSKKSDASRAKFTDVTSQQKCEEKMASKHDERESSILDEAYEIRSQSGTGNYDDVGKTVYSNEVAFNNVSCLNHPTEIGKQTLASRVAWVCCDDCLKWRCIPAELADAIGEINCRWTCKDNQDQAFADCAIPQEKSNAEINAELQISDEEDARNMQVGYKSSGIGHSVASQPSTWMIIKSNLFLHRSRKDQSMDEIMVCHCKPPADGSLGCGRHCLNRMLNIECVQGTCPCGDLCSNQQFQKRQYVRLSWFRCGKKGYGLQVLEDITESQFLIEYVGEVLDLQSYEARQKDYASKGHKHFYFMTLNGNEVIDASAKGNLGRFVNHSCDPNCRTEKWVVNGEICVGLFALRNIKKGEELTFDYNYVRVFGAAAKKCHCGSRKCRGYIGGDPLNTEVIVQGDSDEEFPEPVVVKENGEIDHGVGDMMGKSSSLDVALAPYGESLIEVESQVVVEAGQMVDRVEPMIEECKKIETMTEKDKVDEFHESTDSSTGIQSENLRSGPISTIQNQTSSTKHTMNTPTSSPKSGLAENTTQKFHSGSIDSVARVSNANIKCELPHPCPRMKISRPSNSVTNRKSNENLATVGKTLLKAQRSKFFFCKSKKLMEGSANCHLEAVEEKLNELLDADGGICKKKDASKGYLKLLLLTAASGDSGNGGAIQSNRDLSMILDAILKTKSRGVLLDIINKNGLQMLHNMMKVYRRDFKKIPILRKLLKVFENLAEKEILTVERINKESLHPGVESLRESILLFTNHKDNQVHQIARSFRNRWIPYSLRKFNRMEKNDRRRDFRRCSNSNNFFGTSHHWQEQGATVTERVTCSDQSGASNNSADVRKQEASSSQLIDSQTIANRPRRRKSRWDQPACPRSPKRMRTSSKIESSEGGPTLAPEAMEEEKDYSIAPNSDDDAPPGFSNPCDSVNDAPPGFSLSPKCPSVPLGLFQERFNPRIPVAYGIPLSVVQQCGTLQSGTVDSWAVAPSMPFLPFPPLPPYPRDKRQTAERKDAGDQRDQGMPSTSGESPTSVATNQNKLYHERGGRNFPGKRYYRQKKWNRPPWFRNLDGRGFKGNLGDVNHSVEYAGNSC